MGQAQGDAANLGGLQAGFLEGQNGIMVNVMMEAGMKKLRELLIANFK